MMIQKERLPRFNKNLFHRSGCIAMSSTKNIVFTSSHPSFDFHLRWRILGVFLSVLCFFPVSGYASDNPFLLRIQELLPRTETQGKISSDTKPLLSDTQGQLDTIVQFLEQKGRVLQGKVQFPGDTLIGAQYYVILPHGDVIKRKIASEFLTASGYIDTTKSTFFEVPLYRKGKYAIEFMDQKGYSAINLDYVYDAPLQKDEFSEHYSSGIIEDISMIHAMNRMRWAL